MRKTLLSLAALAALGLASAPAMASDHGMKEHAGKSMEAGEKSKDKMSKEANEEGEGLEREGKNSKESAEHEDRERAEHAKEKMKMKDDETGGY